MQAKLNGEISDGRELLTGQNMTETLSHHALGTESPETGLSVPNSGVLPTGHHVGNTAVSGLVINNDDARKWFVLQTKSRQEKVVCDFFRERQIEHLLPLVAKTTYYGKRKVKSELPLFPGYVFVRSGIQDAYAADRTNRLVRIIPVFDQAKIAEELRSLTRALDAEQPFDRHPHLVAGVRVEVKSGPLQGVRGVVESRLKMDRLVLQVEILGQAISVEVDTDLLVVLEDAPAVAENTKGGVRAA